MEHLSLEAKLGSFDYVTFIGDMAYDHFDDESARGNEFMNLVSDYAQHIPLMVAPGNHEHGDNFTEYVKRFQGTQAYPGARSGSETNFYYSYDVGLIHYVVINTEVYKFPNETVASSFPFTPEQQLEWLE